MIKVLTSDYAYHVLSRLVSVSSSVDILSYVVNFNLNKRSDKANLIFTALKRLSAARIPIRIVLDSPRLHRSNYHCNKFSTRRFKEAGFSVRFLHSGDTQHAKLFLLDRATAITGSHNLTSRSVLNLTYISLLLDDPPLVQYFCSFFDHVWSTSQEV
ncbi:hypothetical protein ES703_112104 [subsurface metagenome]